MTAFRRDRRGSAIISVTMLGLLILAMSTALLSITTTYNRQSYTANKQIVCRYSAEGVLQRIRYQIELEDASDAPGWFDAARQAADPVETVVVPPTPTPDASQVAISVFDPAEASSLLGVTLGTDEYIVQARATSAGHTATMHMKVKYNLSTTTTTTTTPNPADLFSKYMFWMNEGAGLVPGRFAGYIHFNGNLTINNAADRFAMPVTCTGTLAFRASPAWRHFDWDGNGVLDTTPRPQFENMSEADAYNLSGGAKPSVDQPQYQDIDTTLQSAAMTQSALNPSLAALHVDSTNPLYSGLGTLQNCQVRLQHSSVTGLTTATVTVFGSAGSAINNVQLPPDTPLILYSVPRISSLGGTLYGQLTVASAYKGAPRASTSYGGTTVLWPPAVELTDHLIQVDSQGRPKYWLYQNGSMAAQPSRLGLTGPATSSSSNVDNMTTAWTAANGFDYARNPNFDPNAKTAFGVIGNGDVVHAMGYRNHIWNAALYAADPAARVSAKDGLAGSSHTNYAQSGSRTSPKAGYIGPPFDYTLRTYDSDLLVTPPPFWIAPAGVTTTTTSSTSVTTTVGSVYDSTRRY